MYRVCIVVADASRARLFTFEREAVAGGLRDQLVESSDLVNPARTATPSELVSDTRPGTNRRGRLQYAFDDHRDAHVARLDSEFARAIVAELARLVKAKRTARLILCASPNMLGELRDAADTLGDGMNIDEHPRDLVTLATSQIRDQLATYGLLPVCPPRPIARGA